MANIGGALSSGTQGFLAGDTLGPIGGAIGGGIGFLSGLFSDDPADIAKQRWETYKKQLQTMRTNTINTGSQRIGEQTSAAKSDAAIRGRRASIASGRDSQSQSFINPGIERAGTTGAKALNSFLDNTNQQFDNAEMSADLQEVNLPMKPQAGEYFDVAANALGTYGNNKKKYDLLEKAYGSGYMGNDSGNGTRVNNDYGIPG